MSRTIGSTAAETRARILDAARALFAEQGYAGTSVRDLAEVLGITKAALYYHFPGKADILLALLEPLLEELDALGERARDGLERETIVRDYVALLATRAAAIIPLFNDPSAKHDIGERLEMEHRFRALEQALAVDGDVLAVRCALGAAHFGILATLARRARAGEAPEVTDAETERVIRASVAAWKAAA